MKGDAEIFSEAAALSARGAAFALCTIDAASGSVPRTEARLLVRADGSTLGTIGGGSLELRVIADALAALRATHTGAVAAPARTTAPVRHYDASSLGMLCGGTVEVHFDFVPAARQLLVVGAGHVGLALARQAEVLGFTIRLVDDRPQMADRNRFPMAASIHCASQLEAALDEAMNVLESSVPGWLAIVIATHADDERALRFLMRKRWDYLGMLGSRAKVRVLKEKLAAENVDPSFLSRLRAPVGLDLGAETPEEIAISILAEILADLNSADAKHLCGFADTEKREG